MKKLTFEEFQDRIAAVNEAQKIFIDTGITNNITIAFEMYQRILATKERPLVLDSKVQEAHGGPQTDQPPQVTISLDIELEKPTCPDCGDTLNLRAAKPDELSEGYRSCWYCTKCKYEGLSEKSPMRWIRELPEKGAEEVTVESRIEAEDLSGG